MIMAWCQRMKSVPFYFVDLTNKLQTINLVKSFLLILY